MNRKGRIKDSTHTSVRFRKRLFFHKLAGLGRIRSPKDERAPRTSNSATASIIQPWRPNVSPVEAVAAAETSKSISEAYHAVEA